MFHNCLKTLRNGLCFRAHNSDGDDGLDGLELLKAFRHATHNHNDAYENGNIAAAAVASGDVNESGDNMTFDESIGTFIT